MFYVKNYLMNFMKTIKNEQYIIIYREELILIINFNNTIYII